MHIDISFESIKPYQLVLLSDFLNTIAQKEQEKINSNAINKLRIKEKNKEFIAVANDSDTESDLIENEPITKYDKVVCACGSKIKVKNIKQHNGSDKHIRYVKEAIRNEYEQNEQSE